MTNPTSVRPRQDGTSSRLGRALDIDGITSRFKRNKVLIDPKAFFLMTEYDTLRKYRVFAAYKPPFAPMRRKESYENHHRVSVESYVSAALKSRDMEAVVGAIVRGEDPCAPYRAATSSSSSSSSSQKEGGGKSGAGTGLNIKVMNDLPPEAAGPILVHLADPSLYVHNDATRYHFEAIVYGHVQIRDPAAIEAATAAIRASSPHLYSPRHAAETWDKHHHSHQSSSGENDGKSCGGDDAGVWHIDYTSPDAHKHERVGAGAFGTLLSERGAVGRSGVAGSGVGVSATALDGTIRGGYGGTTAAIGATVELDNLALLYPTLAADGCGGVVSAESFLSRGSTKKRGAGGTSSSGSSSSTEEGSDTEGGSFSLEDAAASSTNTTTSPSSSSDYPSPVAMADLPRQRMTAVPRRSLTPPMLRAATRYLRESAPALLSEAEAELAAHERNTAVYAALMEEHKAAMAAYEKAIAAYETETGESVAKLEAAMAAHANDKHHLAAAGIMPTATTPELLVPSAVLEKEMRRVPPRPSPPPPPPQPTIPIAAPARTDAPALRVAIRSFGFYATHPVTLLRFSAQSPSTAAAPDLLRFVRACTGSYVVGDPMARRDADNHFVKSLRAGDKDFPRVFVNLRALGVDVYQRNPLWGDEALLDRAVSGGVPAAQRESDRALAEAPWLEHPKYIEFPCDGSLDVLVADSQLSPKRSRICLTDGYWTPTMRVGI